MRSALQAQYEFANTGAGIGNLNNELTLPHTDLADKMNRRNLFAFVVFFGELSCFCTLFVTSYNGLFLTRAFTGMSIGGSQPLVMSMIADMYGDDTRGRAVAFIQIAAALGVALGQSIAGFVGPSAGWRVPFPITSTPAMLLIPLYLMTTKDPQRGSQEKSVKAAMAAVVEAQGQNPEKLPSEAFYEEKIDCAKIKKLGETKTALLIFIQGIPGSLPWGTMLVFFQDFLYRDVFNQTVTIEQTTFVVLCFGIGAGFGIVLGGFVADRLWVKKYEYVPLFMGVTTIFGALPFFGFLNGAPLSLAGYSVALIPCGFLISMTGTAIRALLMNVTLPETRGSAFALLTLFDDLGKGLGPLWVSLIIEATGSRVKAFNYSICGWFGCAFILLLMMRTVRHDVKRLEQFTIENLEKKQNRGLGDETENPKFAVVPVANAT